MDAKLYTVDYVVFVRNVLAFVVIALVLKHVAGNAVGGKRKKNASPSKSYRLLIFFAMVGLLAMQGLSFWLYAKEAGPPGVTHKTFPLGRQYYVY